MSNNPMIKKWSELKGMPVVSLAEGKKIGTWEDFYFEPATQIIYAFRVKTGLLSHKLLLVAQINTIGQDAVTIANETVLQNASSDEKLNSLPSGESLRDFKVMNMGGTLLGNVGNALIDLSASTAPRITDFELAGGLRERFSKRYETFPATQVQSYGKDVLVISEVEAQKLQS
jgi:uncharacterized protein YrrD